MNLLRTDNEALTIEDIQDYIKMYEEDYKPGLDKLWEYYKGKNVKIVEKKAPDPNNPDNRTPVPYGRKIITTFTGYAYRPRYITYKSENEAYLNELIATFNENNEHIKTSLHGRNTGIFGLSYELLYIDESRMKPNQAEVKFTVIDPREIILLHDYSLEPRRKFAIRYYHTDGDNYKVDVYSDASVQHYDGTLEKYTNKIKLVATGEDANFFGEIPVIPYYLNQEIQSLLDPVIPLLDDYDTLISDSMNEFDRYAHAYLRLVGMSLTDQVKSSSPGVFKNALAMLKYRRVFEQLRDKEDVSFLTKDIPTEYISFMAGLVRDQIHIQSHVPDLGSDAFKDGASGVAIQRLMFDFENVCSNAEAEFDTALYERIRLITKIYEKNRRSSGTFDEITISHKRNAPLNLKEFADTSLVMKNAGFSQYSIVDLWPDDIFPDVEAELQREKEEAEARAPDIEQFQPSEEDQEDEDGDA